jgi:hypothetical protein
MFNQAMFDNILGDTTPIADVQAYSPIGTAWWNRLNNAVEAHWTFYGVSGNGHGDAGTLVWQYDRVYLYYALYKMSGYTNTAYRDRARATADYYVNNYLVSNGYLPTIWFSEMKGVALYYAETGNATALSALGNSHEVRPWVRSFEAVLMCHLASAPSTGHPNGFPGGNDWAVKAQFGLNRLLACQYADGGWRAHDTRHYEGVQDAGGNWTEPGFPWYVRPFYNGLATNILIQYYHSVSADSRIPTAVQANAEFMFGNNFVQGTSGWVPGPDGNGNRNSFKYLEAADWDEHNGDPLGTPRVNGAPDLNGLIVNAYAFAYQQTGNSIWKGRTDLILSGATTYANLDLQGHAGKRLNESFAFAWKAFPMLLGVDESVVTGTSAPTETTDSASVTGRIGTRLRLNWVEA